MKVRIISIFPGFFDSCLGESLLSKAAERGLVEIETDDLRGYATDRHRTVDDEPYGGGAGMVMKVDVWASAIEAARHDLPGCRVVLLSPQGVTLDDAGARRLAREEALVFCCGRYEGVDERVAEHLVDEELSIGDYVLTGGEAAALVAIDAVARKLPGVVGRSESVETDTFSAGLKYPQYTRPPVFRDWEVPPVLRSGNHREIDQWRREQAQRRTAARRPDLIGAALAERTTLVSADPQRFSPDWLREVQRMYGVGRIGLAVEDAAFRERLSSENKDMKVWGSLAKAARRWSDRLWVHVASQAAAGQESPAASRRLIGGEKPLVVSFGGLSPEGAVLAAPAVERVCETPAALVAWLDRLFASPEKSA